MPVTSTNLGNDQGRYIASKLIARSEQVHRFPDFCNPVPLPSGMGRTAEFVKYNRTDVVVDKLSEGVTPNETPFTIGKQQITTDQWGMFICLTDVGIVTTKHPVLNEALQLLGDAVARMLDFQIAEVFLAGTNKQFWDGTRANRAALVATDKVNRDVLNAARADLRKRQVPGRQGDLYVALIDPSVEADLLSETATVGGFVAAQQATTKIDKLEKAVIGTWLGFVIMRSNFMPALSRYAGFAPVAGVGGALTGNVFYKVTRKSLQRGFEEEIAVEGTLAMGANNRLTFTAPATAGYVYNIYVGAATGDSNLFLARENLPASGVYDCDALVGSGTTAPGTPAAGVIVHPIFCFADQAADMVKMDQLSMTGSITPPGPSDSDPLQQRRKVGSKYMSKAGIRDADRVKVVEVASTF